MMRTAALTLALVVAGAARAESVAVLPVDVDRDGAAPAVRAGDVIRAVFGKHGVSVFGDDAVRTAIEKRRQIGGTPLARYQERLATADVELARNQDKSLQFLDDLVKDLAADPDFSREKQAMLEQSRLKLASRLVGLAGVGETGQGETALGRRARALLVDALHAHPSLTLGEGDFPPRVLTLFVGARQIVQQAGTGALRVTSRPPGAHVWLEGRDIGVTPLTLGADVVAKGKYRMWAELGDVKSVPMIVDVTGADEPIAIDLALDGTLWSAGPGLRPVAGVDLDAAIVSDIGKFFGVDTLVLVGASTARDSLWALSFSVADGKVTRKGAVKLGYEAEESARKLAVFLGGGSDDGIDAVTLPPQVLPDRPLVAGNVNSASLSMSSPNAGGAAEDGVSFTTIAIIGGAAAGVALVTAGVIVAVVALTPKNGVLSVTVEELP